MNCRWLIFDYIDPEIGLTPQQRREVNRMAMSRYYGVQPSQSQRIMLLVPVIGLGILQLFRPPMWLLLSLVGACVVVAFVITAISWRRRYAPVTWMALREFGVDVCPHCGYWLRGLSDDATHCPECGEKRVFLIADAKPMDVI